MLPAINAVKKMIAAIAGRLFTSASNSVTRYEGSSPAASPKASLYPSYTKVMYPELLEVYAFQKESLALIVICVSGGKDPMIYFVLAFIFSDNDDG